MAETNPDDLPFDDHYYITPEPIDTAEHYFKRSMTIKESIKTIRSYRENGRSSEVSTS